MKKIYTSFEEIDKDLKTLHLQRQIAMEELKYSRHELKESLTPHQWMSTMLSAIKKYGILYLIRRLFK